MLNLFKISFWIILICNTFVYGQKKADYLLGFDVGRNTLRDPVQMNNEINVNYLLSYKYFMAKAHAGVAPENNFDNIYKFGIATGITTKIEKSLSAHLLLGFAMLPEREYAGTRLRGGYIGLTTGISTNLFKKKNVLIGLNGFFTPFNIDYSSKNGLPRNGIISSFNLSFLYKFKTKDE
jgi:hypothetical protein